MSDANRDESNGDSGKRRRNGLAPTRCKRSGETADSIGGATSCRNTLTFLGYGVRVEGLRVSVSLLLDGW